MDRNEETRIHQAYVARLSDYLDGGLGAPERQEVERHLASCPECARVASDLVEVRERARALGPLAPPRDLWPAIRARLDEPEVYAFPAAASRRPRTFRFTLPQLAAAGLALALATGAGGWGLAAATGAGIDGSRVAPAGPADAASTASAESSGRGLDGRIGALEVALREGQGSLEPNTLRLLEKNLGVIERAIAEARAALEVDPGNAYLERHLRAALERRRAYLEEAVRLASWAD